MNLHEYQAKDLLRKYNLPILEGKSYLKNIDNLGKDLQNIKGPPWVIKSQIHAGGRGAGTFLKPFNTKGGVQITKTIDDAQKIAKGMMGNTLITKQTGNEGKLVNRIYLEAGCEIDREYYLSILLDRNQSKLMLMVSDAGGVDIERCVVRPGHGDLQRPLEPQPWRQRQPESRCLLYTSPSPRE